MNKNELNTAFVRQAQHGFKAIPTLDAKSQDGFCDISLLDAQFQDGFLLKKKLRVGILKLFPVSISCVNELGVYGGAWRHENLELIEPT